MIIHDLRQQPAPVLGVAKAFAICGVTMFNRLTLLDAQFGLTPFWTCRQGELFGRSRVRKEAAASLAAAAGSESPSCERSDQHGGERPAT